MPLPQQRSDGGERPGLDDIITLDRAAPVGIPAQTYAIVWKNLVLAFRCSQAEHGWFAGRCNWKCMELVFYFALFLIMAVVAVAHTVVVVYLSPVPADMYCEDGVLHKIFEKGHAWEERDVDSSSSYSYGGHCRYTNDGYCDEPGTCPAGTDFIDCDYTAPLHDYQFSSCNRTAVSVEMLGVAARALASAPAPNRHRWTVSCDERERNLHGGSCWADLVKSSVPELYTAETPSMRGSYGPITAQNVESCAQTRINEYVPLSGESHSAWCAANPGDGGCLPQADVWFTDATAPGSTSFAELNLFSGNSAAELGWSEASSTYFTQGITMQFREISSGQINARVLEGQKYNRDHTAAASAECVATDTVCPGAVVVPTGNTGGTISSGQYANDASCEWTVTCSDATSIVTLYFTAFST